MFETFGAITKPVPSWWPLLLAAGPLIAAFTAYTASAPRRRVIAVLLACAGADLLPLVGHQVLLAHVGVAARIGELELTVALAVDTVAACVCAAACIVASLLVARQGARRRMALLATATSAVCIMLLADSMPTLVIGAAASSLLGAALGRASAAGFVADRTTEVALIGAAAVAFWALGGSWIHGHYTPELDPRVVVAKAAPSAPSPPVDDDDEVARPPLRGARAWLSFAGLPGSAVAVDGRWVAARTPFAEVPIPAGAHTVRVHVGGGSDDYFVPRLEAADGEHVWLAVRGSTTSFRELRDDLSSSIADERSPAGVTFVRRRLGDWLPIPALVLALAALAFVAWLRLVPFAPSAFEPGRALVGMGCIAIARAFSFGGLAPREVAALASVLACSSGVAWLSAARRKDARGLLGAELALVLPACMAGAPLLAVVHAGVAAAVLRKPQFPARIAKLALLPTHALIIVALYRMPHGAVPALLTVAATGTLLGSHALARSAVSDVADALVTRPAGAMAVAVRLGAQVMLALDGAYARALDNLHRAARAAGAAAGSIEDLILIASPSSLPPLRVLKLAAIPMALVAVFAFALPWLG